jgi:hypothetical protein
MIPYLHIVPSKVGEMGPTVQLVYIYIYIYIYTKNGDVHSVSECNEYSKLATAQVGVLALVPTPEPVYVDIPKCEFTSVPLIVGGEETKLKEFPHMVIAG